MSTSFIDQSIYLLPSYSLLDWHHNHFRSVLNKVKYSNNPQNISLLSLFQSFSKAVSNNICEQSIFPPAALYAGYIPHKRLPNWITSPNLPASPSNIFVQCTSYSIYSISALFFTLLLYIDLNFDILDVIYLIDFNFPRICLGFFSTAPAVLWDMVVSPEIASSGASCVSDGIILVVTAHALCILTLWIFRA